jgi:hypothetical protein
VEPSCADSDPAINRAAGRSSKYLIAADYT